MKSVLFVLFFVSLVISTLCVEHQNTLSIEGSTHTRNVLDRDWNLDLLGFNPIWIPEQRRLMNGEVIGDKICDFEFENQTENGHYLGECRGADYFAFLLTMASPFFVLAGVSLVFGMIFWCFRALCCGGCSASNGICCPEERTFTGYSTASCLCISFVVLVLALLGLAACALGFVSGQVMDRGFHNSFTNLTATVDQLSYNITQIANGFVALDYNNTSDFPQWDELLQWNSTLADLAGNLSGPYARDYSSANHGSSLGLIIVFGFMAFLFVMSIVFLPIRFGYGFFIVPIIGIFLLFCLWMMFGTVYMFGIVTTDGCNEIELFMAGSNDSILQAVLPNCTALASTQAYLNESLVELRTDLHQTYQTICEQNGVYCPAWDAVQNNVSLVYTIVSFLLPIIERYSHCIMIIMIITDDGKNYTLSECAKSCTTSSFRDDSAEAVGYVPQIETALQLSDYLPMASCSWIPTVVANTTEPICKDVLNGVRGSILALGALAILFTLLCVASILAIKRVQRSNSIANRSSRGDWKLIVNADDPFNPSFSRPPPQNPDF